jgi:hypothetical protein
MLTIQSVGGILKGFLDNFSKGKRMVIACLKLKGEVVNEL